MSLLAALEPRSLPPGPNGKPPSGPPALTWPITLGLAGTVLSAFASYLATRLTSFAAADLTGGFGVGSDEASWVVNAYNVGEIVVVPMTAWLGGIISQRRAIAIAMAVLTVASAACPLAPNYTWLVGLRFVEGLGGGALIPLLLSTLLRFMPLHQRVIAFAFYALVTTSTPLLAEFTTGVLTDLLGWEAVFYLVVLLCPVVMMLVLAGLPVEPVKVEGFVGADYVGMLLMALFAGTLTTALDLGQRLDWFDNPLILSLFAASAFLLLAFVLWEIVTPKPLIDLRLLGRRNLACGLVLIFPFSLSLVATSTVVAQYGTLVRGFRELQVGEILIWAALIQAIVCAIGPPVLRRVDTRVTIAVGLALVALGCRFATYIDSDWAILNLIPSQTLVACGQPLVMMGLLFTTTSVLQPEDALSGATLFNVVRTLAGSVGGAVVTGVMTVRERVHSNTMVDHLVSGALPTLQGGGNAALAGATRVQATVMATADAYGMIGVVMVVTMLLLFVTSEVRIARAPA